MSNGKTTRVAIAGVGNCCQALLDGIEYYRQNPDDTRGLMNVSIGGYRVTDIVPVAAFDINGHKVGKDLSEAIYASPNLAYRYPGVEVKKYGVTVQMGPVLDGNPPHLAQFVPTASAPPCDLVRTLKETGAYGTISCNRFSHAVNQVTELCGTEGTIFTATDATNPYQSWPMAVYTNKEYTVDTLPKILKDYRWPELFWVEDIMHKKVRSRWVPMCPPRSPNNYERMTAHYLDCIINDKPPLVSGEDGARAIEVMCAALKSMETGGWVDLPLKEEVIPPFYKPLPREG